MRRLNSFRPLSPLLGRRSELHPGRALLTSTWLVALAVLALNDHVLKGGGLLPGAVTGKLSDFAGMLVAPALLAVLLRVRSRRGLLACHVAVGSVFAGINVSPALAEMWTWLMGLVWPWHVTVDPTDLVAIPALALGWRALVPAMTRPAPAIAAWVPATAQATAVAVGGFFCVATSESGDWDDESGGASGGLSGDEYADFSADVYLHNAMDHDIRVRTRPLRPEVLIDCGAVEEDPGLLLSESLFGAGQTVLLPPTTNTGVRDMDETRPCYAVRVEGDTLLAPFVLFWRGLQVPVAVVEGDIEDPTQHTAGAVLLGEDADLRVSVQESRRPIVYAVDATPPEGAFTPGPDGERLAWSDPPFGEHQLTEVEVGADGCFAVKVDAEEARWYLCAPMGSFPFAVEQWVRVEDHRGALEIRRIADPVDPVAVPDVQLTLSRGAALPEIDDLVLAVDTDYGPAIGPGPGCGTVARPDAITTRFAGGEVVHLQPGESTTLDGEGRSLTLWVAHAEDRVVLDPTCSEGPVALGADIEVAALLVADEP